VVSLPLTVSGYLLTEFGLGPHAAHVTVPVVRAWFAGAAYLTLICVLSAAVATILRSQVLSLTLLLALFSVGSQALAQIPGSRLLMRFLPDLAGARGMAVRPGSADALSPGIGLLVMAGWVVVGLIAAFVVVRRRDA
jgi:hypothetical protein